VLGECADGSIDLCFGIALALKRREWGNGLWERSLSFTNPVLYSSIFEPSREGIFSNDG